MEDPASFCIFKIRISPGSCSLLRLGPTFCWCDKGRVDPIQDAQGLVDHGRSEIATIGCRDG
jgi:hypothetical protein